MLAADLVKPLHRISAWFIEDVASKLLGINDKKYLSSLPLFLEIGDTLLVHGSPLYPWIVCCVVKGKTFKYIISTNFMLHVLRHRSKTLL